MEKAYFIHLNGIVQGVGFRPYVYRLAHEMDIKGWVNNTSHGVYIHAEGLQIDAFYKRLLEEIPPLARITYQECREVPFGNYPDFAIIKSAEEANPDVLISPDIAICSDCLKELQDSKDRRYHYPFINCTNCGPRYTIIRDVPYDRAQTTMNVFPMCEFCAQEYEDPLNRRFHAQPVACPACGPQVQLIGPNGETLEGLGIKEITAGKIVAVKGLGGFHLVCDAANPQAVRELRQRKERGAKPFALMARNLEVVRKYLLTTPLEEELLTSPAAPIVILERKKDSFAFLPEEIAPGLHTLGVMLPYTPLHQLLFAGDYDFLVMTSANLSGQPLIYTNEEALRDLKGIADYFLLHNRDIFHPCDDSVVQVIGEEAVFHRRARGYVPLPQINPQPIKVPILGVGGELKNTFCLGAKERSFTSQYIGDMEGYENFQRFRQELSSFQKVVQITPEAVAYDAHPNYHTTRFALESPWPIKIKTQHHHAHLVSVLGEHGITESTPGVVCDGTGWGEDARIWGFEFLKGNAESFKRLAHLEYLPLPGGDAGSKFPLRIAYAYGKTLLTEKEWIGTEKIWDRLEPAERKILDQQLDKKVQVFETSSAGRLFDAVSALLDICTKVTYEGQAAIELESQAARWVAQNREIAGYQPRYPVNWETEEGCLILKVRPLYQGIIRDILDSKETAFIAYQFHHSLAHAIVLTALKLQVGQGPLVLTGGVFQNKLLTEMVLELCKAQGIQVLRSRELPPGDGGLAFGQVLIGNARCSECV